MNMLQVFRTYALNLRNILRKLSQNCVLLSRRLVRLTLLQILYMIVLVAAQVTSHHSISSIKCNISGKNGPQSSSLGLA